MTHDAKQYPKDDLWRRLAKFVFDNPESERPFTLRLAQEEKWTSDFTSKSVEEYVKFIYIAATCEHPVIPSETIDKVWHLHLLYTHSYWDDLCANIIGRQIHHRPSERTMGSMEFYGKNYRATLDSYTRFFGVPPADIWPSVLEAYAREECGGGACDYWFHRTGRSGCADNCSPG